MLGRPPRATPPPPRTADPTVFNLGAGEMLVVLVVTLLAFGPDRLPEMARRGGQVVTDLRSWSGAARRELAKALEVQDQDGDSRSAR